MNFKKVLIIFVLLMSAQSYAMKRASTGFFKSSIFENSNLFVKKSFESSYLKSDLLHSKNNVFSSKNFIIREHQTNQVGSVKSEFKINQKNKFLPITVAAIAMGTVYEFSDEIRLAILKAVESVDPQKKHSEFFETIIVKPLIKRVHYNTISEFVNEHWLTTYRRKKIARGLADSNINKRNNEETVNAQGNTLPHNTILEENAVLGDRPSQIQAAADKAFEENKDTDKWYYNGSNYYGLLGIDDDLILTRLACENLEQEDVYIIDVGCSRGNWGRHARSILKSEVCKKSGKRFHIFSVTGGKECDEIIKQKDHVILYQLNQFKIENIDEEFSKRGFDLKGKVDLIVSNWTLRHLVDPFGTLKRMYSLLTSNRGILLSNGFLFKFNDSDKVRAFPAGNENIVPHTNATRPFRYWDCGRDAGQFLLMRNNKKELEISLEYTGNVHFISPRYQCASEVVTVFNKRALIKPNFDRDYIEGSPKLYCDKDDQQCKNLYNALNKKFTGLLCRECSKDK